MLIVIFDEFFCLNVLSFSLFFRRCVRRNRMLIARAARWPDLPMMLETDCTVVAWSILHEARHTMEDLRSLEVVKISRSQNNVAHELAHFALRSGSSQVFFGFFSEFVQFLVCNDTT